MIWNQQDSATAHTTPTTISYFFKVWDIFLLVSLGFGKSGPHTSTHTTAEINYEKEGEHSRSRHD
jgi:hypothetical protein